MRTPADKLILKLDKTFEDEIITQSGVKLFTDTFHAPEWHVTVVGDVVAIPDKLTLKPENKGRTMEARVGDKAIISYQVVYDMEIRENDTPIHHNLFYHNGQFFWKVEYFQVLGFIREEGIVPTSGYVFCEAVKEEREARIGLIWLPEMTIKEKPKGRARVVAVGKSKACDPKLSINPGDTVRYNERMAEKYEVNGKEYLVLQQAYILGKEQ